MVEIYEEYMSKVATLLGTKCNTTAKMREIMDFEKQLAKVSVMLCTYLYKENLFFSYNIY